MLDLCRYLSWFRPDHFFTGGNIIMDSYFSWKQWSEVKNVSMELFLTNSLLFTLQYVNWWSGAVWITCGLWWCFYQLFGLILTAPIHCRGSIGEQVMEYHWNAFLQICFHEGTNSSTSWMAWGWVHFQEMFLFAWTILLNEHSHHILTQHCDVPVLRLRAERVGQ